MATQINLDQALILKAWGNTKTYKQFLNNCLDYNEERREINLLKQQAQQASESWNQFKTQLKKGE